MSSSTVSVSPNLFLKPGNRKDQRNLVLFLPWLSASEKAISKYCEFYNDKNFDFLYGNVELKHFLVPSTGVKFAKEILEFLSSNSAQSEINSIFVHSFSIGSYLYSVMLMQMEKNPQKYGCVSQNVCGQVFDSITVGSLERMKNGILEATKNPLSRILVKGMVTSYFALTKSYTVKFYDEAIHQFKEKPLRSPSLFFYCLNDPMADPEAMEDIIRLWRNKFKMDVSAKCWEKSVHAGHFKMHKHEYINILDSFLHRIGLVKSIQSKI